MSEGIVGVMAQEHHTLLASKIDSELPTDLVHETYPRRLHLMVGLDKVLVCTAAVSRRVLIRNPYEIERLASEVLRRLNHFAVGEKLDFGQGLQLFESGPPPGAKKIEHQGAAGRASSIMQPV